MNKKLEIVDTNPRKWSDENLKLVKFAADWMTSSEDKKRLFEHIANETGKSYKAVLQRCHDFKYKSDF